MPAKSTDVRTNIKTYTMLLDGDTFEIGAPVNDEGLTEFQQIYLLSKNLVRLIGERAKREGGMQRQDGLPTPTGVAYNNAVNILLQATDAVVGEKMNAEIEAQSKSSIIVPGASGSKVFDPRRVRVQ